QVPDDADNLVPAVGIQPVQRIAARRADVPESLSERVAAGSDGVCEVPVDDNRGRVRGNLAVLEPATAEDWHLIEIEEGGIDLVEPGAEARQPAVERLGRRVTALDVDKDPGLLAG